MSMRRRWHPFSPSAFISALLLLAAEATDGQSPAAPIPETAPGSTHLNISKASNVYSVPLFGGMEQGEYYVYLEVGTPPLKFRVQVDTGSALLFVPAVECSECTIHTNDLYDISASSTAEAVGCDSELCDRNTCKQSSFCHDTCSPDRNACCAESNPTECGFSVRYGGGTSASGPLTKDVIRLGGLQQKITFGRVTKETGEWLSTVDGIMGMAFKGLDCSPSCVEPMFGELVSDGVVADVFAICMGDVNGWITLGGIDQQFFNGPIYYTPIQAHYGTKYTFYTVSFLDLKLDGASVIQSYQMGDTAVVDSGSTMLLLRGDLYQQLVRHFQAHYCHLQAVCSSPSVLDPPVNGVQSCLEDPPYGEWPVLEVVLDGVQLFIPVELYFVQSNNKYCFAVQPTPTTAGDMNILGDAILRGFYTVYDRVNKSIGFAAADATRCGLPGGGTVNTPPTEGLTPIQMVATTVGCVIVCPLLVVLMAIYRDPQQPQVNPAINHQYHDVPHHHVQSPHVGGHAIGISRDPTMHHANEGQLDLGMRDSRQGAGHLPRHQRPTYPSQQYL